MRHRRGLLSVALTAVVFALPVTAYADSQIPTMSPNAAAPAVNTVAATTVEIKNFTYTPRYFTVPPGATVAVRNDDQVIHTITADNYAFNTGNVAQGVPTTFQAPTKPGKYGFHCFHHPYMTGILTVS
jgi:plastocyanin